MQLHSSPPWMALGAEFESVYGRPPQTEAATPTTPTLTLTLTLTPTQP